jgi:hypothetical protein
MRGVSKFAQLAFQASREMASKAPKERKVAVLGAAGGIGQPLSLLMKVRRRARLQCGPTHSPDLMWVTQTCPAPHCRR